MTQTTTCSAPGKILIAGGYLVLDPSFSGLVLSLSARIYANISPAVDEHIVVRSPQFKDAVWTFSTACKPIGKDNVFIREALNNVMLYLDDFRPVTITIHADNQYYSLAKSDKRFSSSSTTIEASPKTGLGSSAALVTAITAALYINKKNTELTIEEQRIIHNLAQISHCRAQGKVGSGFDIAAATFGSCMYSRFPASIIPTEQVSTEILKSIVNSKWQMGIDEIRLHSKYILLMGDVAQGSSTPGMVKKVMASKTALDVWPSLAMSNELLVEQLVRDSPDESVRETTRSMRGLLKQMGVLSGVEIEPDAQSIVLDATLAIEGVVSCGVPGAGGYDAIFAIIRRDSAAKAAVIRLWRANNISKLDIYDDHSGVRIETNFTP